MKKESVMKPISLHRVNQYCLVKQIVEKFEALKKQKFQIADKLGGQQGWCDAVDSDNDDWLECVSVFQNEDLAENILKKLVCLVDIPQIEQEHSIKIDPNSKPCSKEIGVYSVDTKTGIRDVVIKKTDKNYPYLINGYSEKGILIVGIYDPLFGGFKKDIELTELRLSDLREETQSLMKSSSFNEILLVDALSNFHHDPENLTYRLF